MIKQTLSIGDNKTRQAIQNSLNKTITDISIISDNLYITFDDNTSLRVWDEGPHAYLGRQMNTYNNIKYFIGTKLINVYSKPLQYEEDDWGGRETMLMGFETNNGEFIITYHNGTPTRGFSIAGEITDPWISKS